MSKNKRLLMIVGDYNEVLEVYFPYQALTMLGYVVDTISPDKKTGDHIVTAVHDLDEPNLQTYTEKRGHQFPITANFDSIKLEDYAGLIIPGGRAAEYQRMNQAILDIVRYFSKQDLPIACLCHGIQILAVAGILKNRTCTAVPFCEPDVKMAGGNFVNKGLDGTIVDGKLVTGATWFANAEWIREFHRVLAG